MMMTMKLKRALNGIVVNCKYVCTYIWYNIYIVFWEENGKFCAQKNELNITTIK